MICCGIHFYGFQTYLFRTKNLIAWIHVLYIYIQLLAVLRKNARFGLNYFIHTFIWLTDTFWTLWCNVYKTKRQKRSIIYKKSKDADNQFWYLLTIWCVMLSERDFLILNKLNCLCSLYLKFFIYACLALTLMFINNIWDLKENLLQI